MSVSLKRIPNRNVRAIQLGYPVGTHVSRLEVASVIRYAGCKGFVYDSWQVAAFITAVRVKPFVILAGIPGTGKTKLPRLVAEATGAEFSRIAVRPDWHDSSDLLGYENLSQQFVPGQLLKIARRAMINSNKQYFVLFDEMNIAHVEYYLAEVLSHMEEFFEKDGARQSHPLLPDARDSDPDIVDPKWNEVCLPANLCIVGSVNMDETTFGFSPKVLDRSFVIDFSSVSLSREAHFDESVTGATGDVAWWSPPKRRGPFQSNNASDQEIFSRVIKQLEIVNDCLPKHMRVGYRVRDEIALFVSVSQEYPDCFIAEDSDNNDPIDPLDIAMAMKVLPRIHGSQSAIGNCIRDLLKWAGPDIDTTGMSVSSDSFAFCAGRIRGMRDQLNQTGFASFWL